MFNSPTDTMFSGTQIFDRPELSRPTMEVPEIRSRRLDLALSVFQKTLDEKQEVRSFVEPEEPRQIPSPVGYLIGGRFLIPIFPGATVVSKREGSYTTETGGASGGSVVAVLQASRSNASISIEGQTDLFHHGHTLSLDGHPVKLVLFSTDLWMNEVDDD